MLLVAVALPWGFASIPRLAHVPPLVHSASASERSAEELYQQGDQLLDAGQFDAARQVLQQVLELYQQSNNRAGQTKTLKTLGHTYYYQERYKESIPYYKQSLEVARQIPDLDAQGRALLYLGV
jgi:tetratricopeptide (TPR) repeat protein